MSIVNWEKTPAVGEKSGSAGFQPAASGILPDGGGAEGSGAARFGTTARQDAGQSGQDARAPLRKLTFQRGDSVDSPWETFELPVINPALSIGTDVTGAQVLVANEKAKKCYTGQNPVNAGFFLTPDEAAAMIKADPRNREVLFPCMIGRDLVEEYGPTRWIIDFAKRDQFAARSYALPWERVQERVMPVVLAKAEAEKKAQGKEVTRYTRIAGRWWQFYDYRPGTIAAINSVPRYVACPRMMKRQTFEFVSQQIHADSQLVVFAFADDYSFGILSSGLHWQWFLARCSTMKADFRYTSDTVFDTFPWPQSPTRAQIAEVAAAAVALRALRREIMGRLKYSLRDLYRTLDTPGANPLRDAHTRLDTAVRAAYGLEGGAASPPKAKKRGADEAAPSGPTDPLAFLLALNLELAAKESSGARKPAAGSPKGQRGGAEQKAGEPITPPGLPLPAAELAAFITEDCITAGNL